MSCRSACRMRRCRWKTTLQRSPASAGLPTGGKKSVLAPLRKCPRVGNQPPAGPFGGRGLLLVSVPLWRPCCSYARRRRVSNPLRPASPWSLRIPLRHRRRLLILRMLLLSEIMRAGGGLPRGSISAAKRGRVLLLPRGKPADARRRWNRSRRQRGFRQGK